MQNYNKIFKLISSFVENGILSAEDLKKEVATSLKFQKDKIINDLQLVKRDEFINLKKIVQKQAKEIKELKKKKKKSRR